MRILIFEPLLIGHHLEYLHHIYLGAIRATKNTFVFAVPRKEWEIKRTNYVWPEGENIEWLALDDEECEYTNRGNLFIKSLRLSVFIRRIAIQVNAQRIFLIQLANAVPFLPLMLPGNMTLTGIIYKIYLRSNKRGIRKALEKIRYTIMAHSKNMERAFILNDSKSAKTLNSTYHTHKFLPLADPVPGLDGMEIRDLKESFEIPDGSIIFLHFGAMEERKGTLLILEALSLMPQEKLKNKYFIFAGCVGEDIKSRFYSLIDSLKSKGTGIRIIDGFCSYEMLNSLCKTSDCILIPYLLTDLSSGALGYAAVHDKPVIGPSVGLIGELIRENGLGQTLGDISAKTLSEAIDSFIPHPIHSEYVEKNSRDSFINTIIKSLTTS